VQFAKKENISEYSYSGIFWRCIISCANFEGSKQNYQNYEKKRNLLKRGNLLRNLLPVKHCTTLG
jgi:hypothetical protein